ncbi:MAG: hypothetical protein R3E13_09885 [Alphaproteobacteria bacterium]
MSSLLTLKFIQKTNKQALAAQPLSRRFSNIAALVFEVERHIPELREDDRYAIDTLSKHKNVRPHVEAMIKISETIRHTPSYLEFLEKSRKILLQAIADDKSLFESLLHYPISARSDKEAVIKAVGKYHAVASGESTQFDFKEPPIVFAEEAGRYYEHAQTHRIIHGSSSLNIQTGEGKITINTHEECGFENSFNAIGTVFHEGVHDQIGQLAYAQHSGNGLPPPENLTYDAELFATYKRCGAKIPSGIYSAYREQFHEIVAFEQQEKFMRGLSALLAHSPTF